jgi:hypothetical protein
MRNVLLAALLVLLATPADTWDWDLHYHVAVSAGIPKPAAHGVSYPDMMRPHVASEGARHYMNADFFPAAYPLGALPITFATFAAQVTQPDKMGYLLYEILYYAAAYRADRALLQHGDFNENLLRTAHYLADLYMPLHLTRNYDGQETGQKGAHERLEDYADAKITVVKAAPFPAIQSDADLWRTLQREALRTRALVPAVLAADAAAQNCGKPYGACFGSRQLLQAQADRAAGFLVALRAYLDAPGGETARYAHRE